MCWVSCWDLRPFGRVPSSLVAGGCAGLRREEPSDEARRLEEGLRERRLTRRVRSIQAHLDLLGRRQEGEQLPLAQDDEGSARLVPCRGVRSCTGELGTTPESQSMGKVAGCRMGVHAARSPRREVGSVACLTTGRAPAAYPRGDTSRRVAASTRRPAVSQEGEGRRRAWSGILHGRSSGAGGVKRPSPIPLVLTQRSWLHPRGQPPEQPGDKQMADGPKRRTSYSLRPASSTRSGSLGCAY